MSRTTTTLIAILLLCLCAGGLLVGIHSALHPAFPTEEQVRRVVTPGMSETAVIKAFGPPFTVVTLPDGTRKAIYEDPDRRIMHGRNPWAGFQVNYQSNVVVWWAPTESISSEP